VACVFTVSAQLDWKFQWLVVALMVVNIISHVVATIRQWKGDSALSLPAKRKLFPILEFLKRKVCVLFDTLGLIIHIILILLVFVVIVYLYYI